MLWAFLNPKNCNYIYIPFKHLKKITIIFFVIFFICLIASWFEIENGKKMLLSISITLTLTTWSCINLKFMFNAYHWTGGYNQCFGPQTFGMPITQQEWQAKLD
jgi:hypothetical protein